MGRCNTNSTPLGAGAASVATSLYQIKYIGKETTEIAVAGPVFLDAQNKVDKYESKAEDKGSEKRRAMNFAHYVLNHASMELAATQAASLVLGHKSGRSSHVLEYHYAWDYVKLMQAAARGDIMGGSPDSVDGDIGADRDADGDISSARTTFGGGDHDVVGSDHGADYAVDIVGDSADGVSGGGGGRDVSTDVAS